MSSNKAPKRSRLFVDRAVQGKLAKRFLFHWCSLAFCMFIMTAMIHVISSPFESPHKQMETYLQQNGKIFFILIVLTPAFIWDSIKFSHRFAGPMVRLRRELKLLADGEAAHPLAFRPGDFWEDLATSYTEVRERVLIAEQQLAEARALLGQTPEPELVGEDRS